MTVVVNDRFQCIVSNLEMSLYVRAVIFLLKVHLCFTGILE